MSNNVDIICKTCNQRALLNEWNRCFREAQMLIDHRVKIVALIERAFGTQQEFADLSECFKPDGFSFELQANGYLDVDIAFLRAHAGPEHDLRVVNGWGYEVPAELARRDRDQP